jgi:hypothetical protein
VPEADEGTVRSAPSRGDFKPVALEVHADDGKAQVIAIGSLFGSSPVRTWF